MTRKQSWPGAATIRLLRSSRAYRFSIRLRPECMWIRKERSNFFRMNLIFSTSLALQHEHWTERRGREDALNASVNTPLPTGYSEGTNAYQLIAKLIPATTLGRPSLGAGTARSCRLVRSGPSRTRWHCRAIEKRSANDGAPAKGGATSPSDAPGRHRGYRREAWGPGHRRLVREAARRRDEEQGRGSFRPRSLQGRADSQCRLRGMASNAPICAGIRSGGVSRTRGAPDRHSGPMRPMPAGP